MYKWRGLLVSSKTSFGGVFIDQKDNEDDNWDIWLSWVNGFAADQASFSSHLFLFSLSYI